MAEEDDNIPGEMTRVPTREDVIKICSALNKRNAKYIVVGGAAIIELGLMRSTMDVDLLVDANSSNVAVVCDALAFLPDQASQEVQPEDVQSYTVVRINDEFTIDLMGSACGITYEEALRDVEWKELDGVKIPFASAQLLWKTKQTYREKDALDRSFLRKWFADHGLTPPTTDA
jgi:predicted nucleotidyltransferase